MYDHLSKSIIPPAILAAANAILAAVEQSTPLSVVATAISAGWLAIAIYDRVIKHLEKKERQSQRKGK